MPWLFLFTDSSGLWIDRMIEWYGFGGAMIC